MADENSKFVALEGIDHGNRFYTTNTPGNDPTKSAKGETWYRILGYGDTSDEMEKILYPTQAHKDFAMMQHMTKMFDMMDEECRGLD